MARTRLIVSVDDYGVSPRWDAGILEAVEAGAVDAVAVMVDRGGEGRIPPLLASGIETGLHLELGWSFKDGQAGPAERDAAGRALAQQLKHYGRLLGRPPDFLNGHHHCHARPGIGAVIADAARERGLPLRSISPRHRRLLRCRGVATPGLLVGRLTESEPLPPAELDRDDLPATVEWMVHPGHPDPSVGSSYDRGRAEDLRLLLGWQPPEGVQRSTHRVALRSTC